MFDKFGNRVRIVDSPETRAIGLAGKVGEITRQTTPSMMDFEIVGIPKAMKLFMFTLTIWILFIGLTLIC